MRGIEVEITSVIPDADGRLVVCYQACHDAGDMPARGSAVVYRDEWPAAYWPPGVGDILRIGRQPAHFLLRPRGMGGSGRVGVIR